MPPGNRIAVMTIGIGLLVCLLAACAPVQHEFVARPDRTIPDFAPVTRTFQSFPFPDEYSMQVSLANRWNGLVELDITFDAPPNSPILIQPSTFRCLYSVLHQDREIEVRMRLLDPEVRLEEIVRAMSENSDYYALAVSENWPQEHSPHSTSGAGDTHFWIQGAREDAEFHYANDERRFRQEVQLIYETSLYEDFMMPQERQSGKLLFSVVPDARNVRFEFPFPGNVVTITLEELTQQLLVSTGE